MSWLGSTEVASLTLASQSESVLYCRPLAPAQIQSSYTVDTDDVTATYRSC